MDTSIHTSKIYFFDNPISRSFTSGTNYMIIYISKGTCYFNIEETDSFCTTEDMILLKPNQKTVMTFSGQDKALELIILKVSPEYIMELSSEQEDLLRGFEFVPFKVASVRSDSAECMLIKNIAAKLAHIQEEKEAYCHTLYEKNLFSIVLILTIRACIHADQVHRKHRRKHLLMDELFLYIREHLTEDFSLENVSGSMSVSPIHFHNTFKTATGKTLRDYVEEQRIKKSINMLLTTNFSLTQIAYECGFSSQSYFSYVFKRRMKVTPREYTKEIHSKYEI